MSARTFTIGTRGSRLATRQTEITLSVLSAAHAGARFDTRAISTSGDRSQLSLAAIGGRGVFVIEVERALQDGEIDLAVHSLKDLPSAETGGLEIGAFLPREDPRDVLISGDGSTLDGLPPGAAVGTGSPRRAAQLTALRPDIQVRDIRGNVDTRLRKVEGGDYEAVVLAAAGLARLGWSERASQVFEPEEMLPAVGQGALALQARADDADALAILRAVDDRVTRDAVTAERAFERRLGGGCHAAVAAYATVGYGPSPERAPLRLRGLVGGEGRILRGEMEAPAGEADALGVRLAEYLIAQGAESLLEASA
ncbi:MAG TPA: hydroxymethylbilane synthase [Dehalococcoidia bacterium]